MMKWLLLPAAWMLVGATDSGPLPSVFGIQLGVPLSVPECQTMAGHPDWYDVSQPRTCFHKPVTLNDHYLPTNEIDFADDATPLMVKYARIYAYVIDGKVAGIEFVTDGVDVQDYVLVELVKKFGPADGVNHSAAVGPFGRTVSVLDAKWSKGGYTVTFEGAGDKLNYGWVKVLTPPVIAANKAGDDAQAAKRPSL